MKVLQILFSDRINIVRQTCETGKLVPDRSYKINKSILIIKLFDGLADSEARRLKNVNYQVYSRCILGHQVDSRWQHLLLRAGYPDLGTANQSPRGGSLISPGDLTHLCMAGTVRSKYSHCEVRNWERNRSE